MGECPCPDCEVDARAGRCAPGRYCALGRCYCGHPSCPAYPSWQPRRHLDVVPDPPARQATLPSAWDDRDQPTWIDDM